MPTDHENVRNHLARLLRDRPLDEVEASLLPSEGDISPRVAGATRITPDAIDRRWSLLRADAALRAQLLDNLTASQMEAYSRNIENFIGPARVPIGLAGPLRVRGVSASGDYYVPLATTEAALVASYTRGAQVVSLAGGCSCVVVNEGVSRAPGFAFRNIADAGRFIHWATTRFDDYKSAAEASTRHGKLTDMRVTLEGNHVFLVFVFTTGDAAGQNMVTIATEAVCKRIIATTPIQPEFWFVEANMSGDKKASMQSFQSVRGRKTVGEATIPADIISRRLHCTVRRMVDYYRISSVGAVMSGIVGIQGHYANGLAAVYLACGQDVACVAESAVGITRLEENSDGDLYISVTLPNLIVGTVGGGTALPTQSACLEIMGCAGNGRANAFAEVCTALLLAGEISIIGSLAAQDFARAHQRLARGRENTDGRPGASPETTPDA